MSFRAIQVTRAAERGAANEVALVDLDEERLADPGLGEVLIDVEFSSLNFKDGIALRGEPGIVREDRLIAGIDLAGIVRESASEGWRPGDRVVVTGCGLGETHPGGLAERARMPSDWLVRVPEPLSTRQAAAIGTAGVTAALAVLELESAGVGPGSEVVVTGAAGGVGTLSILLGAAAGWRVTAVTGREALAESLRQLGAESVADRGEFDSPGKALESARWHGAIDTVGGDSLARLLSQLRYGGVAAACGNAASSTTTVSLMPFLLRGVTLAGINSVDTPQPLRRAAWTRLERDLDLGRLDELTEVIPLEDAISAAERFRGGGVHGRLVVDVRR